MIVHTDKNRLGKISDDEHTKEVVKDGKVALTEYYYDKKNVDVYDIFVHVYKDGVNIGSLNVGLSMKSVKEVTWQLIKKRV